MKYIVKTFQGLEPVLEKELEVLGASEITLLKRAVSFEGDQTVLYKANLYLRTALRILHPIHEFEASNEEELYQAVYDFDWSPYLSLKTSFAIDSFTHSNLFKHSKYVALKTKDAICDQFRKKTGARPNVDRLNADVRLSLHLSHKTFKISLDASGESLHKRGFRGTDHRAPINEVLAAGMVLLSEWDGDCTFVDPMCGSGTSALEAAMIAKNQPPNLLRHRFGFQNWNDYDADLWEQIVKEAKKNILRNKQNIWASDAKKRAIESARRAAENAHLHNCIKFNSRSFQDLDAPSDKGVLIINPPYGERMAVEDIGQLYKDIGNHLKQYFSGYEAWIISSNKEALKYVGLRPSKKITLFNGPLECKFQKYELYDGSRKTSKNILKKE